MALDDKDRQGWLIAFTTPYMQVAVWLFCPVQPSKDHTEIFLAKIPNQTVFIHLVLDQKILEQRLKSHRGHFFNPSLLQDQLNTLEELDTTEIGFTVKF